MAGRPREFKKPQTLKKAIQVFWAKGYEGTSMDDLCSAMGINRPSLYKAFGNKESLYLLALGDYQAGFEAEMEQILNAESDGKQAIIDMLEWVANSHEVHQPPLGCMMINSGIICGPEHQKITAFINENHARREKILQARLQRAQEEGQIKRDTDVRALARHINGIMQGMGVIVRGRPGTETLQDMIKYTALTLSSL